MQTKKSITSAVLAVLSNLAFAAAFHGCTGQVDVKFPSGSAGENNSSDESTPQNDSGEPEKEQGGTPTPNVTPTVTPKRIGLIKPIAHRFLPKNPHQSALITPHLSQPVFVHLLEFAI